MYTTAEGDDKREESRSFGNSHTLLVNGTFSKIRILHKHGAPFEMIAARIYSTQTLIEIPLLEESLIRLVFQNCNQTVAWVVSYLPNTFKCLEADVLGGEAFFREKSSCLFHKCSIWLHRCW